MVATRGGARTGADDATVSTIRAKTGRGTTSRKTVKTTTTKASLIAKTTRSKKTEPEPEPEQSDDELQGDPDERLVPRAQSSKPVGKGKTAPAPERPARTVPKAATRVKRGRKPEESEAERINNAEIKAVKTIAARKPKVIEEQEKQNHSVPIQSRATRATRATAAKGKAAALSPKKITQVKKAPARSTRVVTSGLASIPKKQLKAASASKSTLRKRNISDENATVPQPEPVEDSADMVPLNDEYCGVQTNSDTMDHATLASQRLNPLVDDMGSHDELDSDPLRDDQSDESDIESECDSGQVSGDELSGPKTPMKRCSPRETWRYTSTRKSSFVEENPMRTPVRRFAVLGTQMGTPQTQKPYCKPAVPMSERRPMTVARARNQAMVFPQLQPLPDDFIHSNIRSYEGNGVFEKDAMLTFVEMSPITASHKDGPQPNCSRLSNSTMSDADSEEDLDVQTALEDMCDTAEHSSFNGSEPVEDPDDSEATVVIMPDAKDEDEEADSGDHDDRVRIPGHTADSVGDGNFLPETPIPETLIWGNVHQDVTIPFNFDMQAPLLHKDSVEATFINRSGEEVNTIDENKDINVATQNSPALVKGKGLATATVESPSRNIESVRASLDATVNLSDFLHLDSPSESSRASLISLESLIDTDVLAGAVQKDVTNMNKVYSEDNEPTSYRQGPPSQVESWGELPQSDRPGMTTPPYAKPTIASRRRSVPTFQSRTPVADGTRPRTANDALAPGFSVPAGQKWLIHPLTPSEKTPTRPDLNAQRKLAIATQVHNLTPTVKTPTKTPATSVPMTFRPHSSRKTPVARMLFAGTPVTSVPLRTNAISQERYPGLPPREKYELDAVIAAGDMDENATVTPRAVTEERFPGLPCRRTYEEHANTALPASRFLTPAKVRTKQPATTQKPMLLRKAVFASACTPKKTPLKANINTPGLELLTPHPAAPLRGVVAMVEVYTSDGDCATPVFTSLLQRLGAKTTKTFSDRITHLVFKEGPPNVLQRLRVHNKQVAETGIGNEIHCVNSRWVSDCDVAGMRAPEMDEAYMVDLEDGPRSAKRRRKSMEPLSLVNLGGNVVRKSSLGRASIGRGAAKLDSPTTAVQSTPKTCKGDKENLFGEGSPATPAYLSAPELLVQQTLPANRMKRIESGSGDQAKNRRLTFWSGRS